MRKKKRMNKQIYLGQELNTLHTFSINYRIRNDIGITNGIRHQISFVHRKISANLFVHICFGGDGDDGFLVLLYFVSFLIIHQINGWKLHILMRQEEMVSYDLNRPQKRVLKTKIPFQKIKKNESKRMLNGRQLVVWFFGECVCVFLFHFFLSFFFVHNVRVICYVILSTMWIFIRELT